MTLTAIRGTRDILPEEVEAWQRVESAARRIFDRYGFGEIRTPIFEDSAVFLKGTGADSDIVQKEMYRFTDLGDNDITLRPEGTPPVARAYIEHGLGQGKQIDRYYYIGPMFRYERPQKGRYRQFHQIGVEVFGSEAAAVDAEVIEMAVRWLRELDVRAPRLVINSVGDDACRPGYRDALRSAQEERLDDLCADCRRRHRSNPLRVFDCKVPSCQPVIAELPTIQEHLCADCRRHFDTVRDVLIGRDVQHEVDPRLVRGLDYYRRTVFEVTSEALGAQDSLLGGGRYDGLLAAMGGEDTPGVGFASGVERVLLAMPEQPDRPATDVYVVAFDADCERMAQEIAHRLRVGGVRAITSAFEGRKKSAQMRAMKSADAPWAIIVGPDEISSDTYTIKDASGTRVEATGDALVDVARELVAGADGH